MGNIMKLIPQFAQSLIDKRHELWNMKVPNLNVAFRKRMREQAEIQIAKLKADNPDCDVWYSASEGIIYIKPRRIDWEIKVKEGKVKLNL